MKTRIIVDSTADLMPEYKSRVSVVPLTVHFGEEEYIDGVTIDHKTFYEKLIESDVLPSTSQATPDTFMKEFEKAKTAGEAAVVITLASKFSGTYQSAMIAAAEYCIGSPWWHRGIVSEALAAVIEYLFIEVGMNRVAARKKINFSVLRKPSVYVNRTGRYSLLSSPTIW